MSIDANKAVAIAFLKALGSGDVKTLQSVMTDDAVAITAGHSAVSGSRDRDLMLRICAALPQITKGGIVFEILNLTAEEDRVACEAQGRSTMVGGMPYDNQYHFLFHFSGGKIRLVKEYLDNQLADAIFGPYLAAAIP